MSITVDFISYLRGKEHQVVDRRGKAMGGNVPNRSLSGITKGGQHWDGVDRAKIENHENYWKNTLGWRDGGYTVFVDNSGTIYVNYDFEKRTNGVGNHNTPTLNFCYGGTWADPLNEKQKSALTNMWAFVVNDSRININSFQHILGHKEFSGHTDNACPGIDMKRFRHDISRGNTHISVNITEPKDAKSAELVKYEEGTFIAGTAIKVRNAPSTAAKHTGTLKKDDVVIYDRVYEGGGYRWLSYVSHSGARLYLPYRPSSDIHAQWGTFSTKKNQQTDPNQYVSGAELVKYEKGTFTPTTAVKVRNRPTTHAKHTSTLQSGQSIDYDRVYKGNGYRWLSYIGGSGHRLYLPYRPIDDTENQWGTFS